MICTGPIAGKILQFRGPGGNIRMRLDLADGKTLYPHAHLYDTVGRSLDFNLKPVDFKFPDAHIPIK